MSRGLGDVYKRQVFVPAIFSLYFDLFDGLIQTYVFVFLTSLFMKESIGGEE